MKTKVLKILMLMLVLACSVFAVNVAEAGAAQAGIYIVATEINPLEFLPEYPILTRQLIILDLLEEFGTTVASSEDFISIIISRGMLSTGGYGLEIESVERNGYAFVVNAAFIDPPPGALVPMIITNPVNLVPIGKLPAGEYSITVNVFRFFEDITHALSPEDIGCFDPEYIERFYHYFNGLYYLLTGREVWTSTFRILDELGVLNVATPKTVVGQGFNLKISVTVGNYAVETETFNVTVYANETSIATFKNITLPSRNSTTLTFIWDTTGFAKGNYTISAVVSMDDAPVNSWVCVVTPGDVNADGIVNIEDVTVIAKAYGSYIGHSRYDTNADVNGDGEINIEDLFIAAKKFGKTN